MVRYAGRMQGQHATKFYTAATATFTKNQAGSFIAASSGCPAPTITETGKLPAGVTLKTGGVISGKPTVTGTFKVTFRPKSAPERRPLRPSHWSSSPDRAKNP